ncbi:MAG: HAMP domain-containing histidine kinase [Ruminococcus sp.]|nr:HAMP domain-containing histidine kinase [Ruminococcus sp.]
MVFTVLILLLLWVFQYFFLARYYRSARIRDMSNISDKLISAYSKGDIANEMKRMAFDNSMCIVVTDTSGRVSIAENNLGSISYFMLDLMNSSGYNMHLIKQELAESRKDELTKIVKNENIKSEEILLCRKFETSAGSGYLYIEASVDPVDSTVSIIRQQLIYITIIIFELAFIITLFISKRLSAPIVHITGTAKKFASGDFSVKFEEKGYREVGELSEVLENAKDEISKVNKLRTDLIANISHDLRTPLTMVKAYAEMIRDLSGDDPEKRNEHLGIIIDEADRLSNLVNNILELSKLESGNIELKYSDFSLHDKINSVLTRYTLLIEQNGYDISFEPDEDRTIHADAEKLDQVLYNFINNAINYSGEQKVIRIRQINREDAVRIEVSDNGKGISKELLPKVFDRYYRGEKVKRDVVGTGLGLSICKEILKKHGFAFGVQSEEGKGSTFWFEVRLHPAKELPAAKV